ncbi:MAG: class I SAM-dependent methyltransferase [Bacteroidales bacterium]|nr:class I SAM-dependent methyltransferase [Bacteroidales bacterium]
MNKYRIIFKYLRFLFKAKHYKGHGVHSPYVYKFVSEVIFDNSRRKDYKKAENYRKSLLKKSDVIKVIDFGAGSKIFNTDYRKIKNIAKYSSTKKKYGKLLYRIVNYCKPTNVIEFGTSLGLGTLYLALGNNKSNIYTIEASDEVYQIASQSIKDLNVNNVKFINNKFEDAIPEILSKLDNVEIVFFDGNHTKKATLDYFNKCLKKINNNSIFIFDDINWSKDMEQAWKTIKSNPKTKVSIDLFQFGIVLFKEELSKEHFIVRF